MCYAARQGYLQSVTVLLECSTINLKWLFYYRIFKSLLGELFVLKCLLCKNYAFKHSILTILLPPQQHYIIENRVKVLELWWLPILYSLKHGCILQTIKSNCILIKSMCNCTFLWCRTHNLCIVLKSGDPTYIQLFGKNPTESHKVCS